MIFEGDSLEQLKHIKSDSIDCVITSPPYWGLRDYGHSDQLGLEPDFRDYISNLVDIFDEVMRVLKPSGTCWVNIGDTYAANRSYQVQGTKQTKGSQPTSQPQAKNNKIKPKCLVQIPSRFAIEMIDRGWILRNEIIWHKPNAMPQSVVDRFTVDYEKIFLFVKNKKYYFDQHSVAEPITDSSAIRLLQDIENQKGSNRGHAGNKSNGNMKAVIGKGFKDYMGGGGSTFKGHSGYKKADGTLMLKPTRNKRSVWTIATKGFKDAHFAVYPEELVSPMIKA